VKSYTYTYKGKKLTVEVNMDLGDFTVEVKSAVRKYYDGIRTFDNEEALAAFLLHLKASFRNKVDSIDNVSMLEAIMKENEFL
tara:strand:+ start:188 stop:436 length:249 start_codon:yes stop_codon:yes gene_type:complete